MSTFAIISCVSQPGGAVTGSYEMAKVYLSPQVPVPGQSGEFWNGLVGTAVNRHPWIGGPEDANGVFYLAADEKTLLFRAEVSDSAPQFRSADMDPAEVWNGTSVQIFFGVNTARHTEYDEGDTGLSFWMVQDEDGNPKVMASKGRLLNNRQYKAAVVEWADNSYIIEASFSLDFLAVYKPFKANQKVRCEFRINHAEQGQPRSVIVNWRTPTDDAWQNPNTWSDGIVVLRP